LNGYSWGKIIKIGACNIAFIRVVQIYLRQIKESVLGAADLIITHQTIGNLEFQHGDHILVGFEKPLVRYDPSRSQGREIAPPFIFMEAFRTIISKGEFPKIFVAAR